MRIERLQLHMDISTQNAFGFCDHKPHQRFVLSYYTYYILCCIGGGGGIEGAEKPNTTTTTTTIFCISTL